MVRIQTERASRNGVAKTDEAEEVETEVEENLESPERSNR